MGEIRKIWVFHFVMDVAWPSCTGIPGLIRERHRSQSSLRSMARGLPSWQHQWQHHQTGQSSGYEPVKHDALHDVSLSSQVHNPLYFHDVSDFRVLCYYDCFQLCEGVCYVGMFFLQSLTMFIFPLELVSIETDIAMTTLTARDRYVPYITVSFSPPSHLWDTSAELKLGQKIHRNSVPVRKRESSPCMI